MGIRTYIHHVKQLYFLKKTIKKYRPHMKNGTYVLFPSMRALAACDGNSLEAAKKYFIHHTKTRENRLVNFVNKHSLFKVKKSNGKFEAIYVANNHNKKREVKLFSFQRKKILTVCVSEEDNEKQLQEYELLHKAYGMPAVTQSSLFPCSHEIAMISLSDRPTEEQAIAAITAANERFNPDTSVLAKASKEDLLSFAYENEEMNALLTKIKEQIKVECLDVTFPLCLQHGDLSQDNLMYGTADETTGFFWIDWEHKRDRIFFYDLFFYMLNSAFCSEISEPLDSYLRGDCDGLLKKHFAYFGLSYDSEKRKDYFLLFAIVFCKERLCPFQRTAALQQYVDFLLTLNFTTKTNSESR